MDGEQLGQGRDASAVKLLKEDKKLCDALVETMSSDKTGMDD